MFKNADSVKKTSLNITIEIMTSLKMSIERIRSKETETKQSEKIKIIINK